MDTGTMLRSIGGVLLAGLLLLLNWTVAEAEMPTTAQLMEKYGLSPGMKITAENAHLIKELVPEAFYRRVVAGEYALTIGKFDPPDILTKVFTPQFYQESERHVNQYDVNEDGSIKDKTTGERPWPMPYGFPFPKIDFKEEDPKKVGTKIWWNSLALAASFCELEGSAGAFSTPAKGFPDRYFFVRLLRQYLDFRQHPLKIDRPLSFQEISLFLEPADAWGTVSLTWRWIDPKKWDSVWNYSPAVRRVRRLTAANRSDAQLGTESIQDDSNNYNGKLEMFEWKYIEQRPMLMPVWKTESQFQTPDDTVARVLMEGKPARRFPGSQTAYEAKEYRKTRYAWNEDPQQYPSWWPLDVLWVPVWAYVTEGFPKDTYYNYGRQIFWQEAITFAPIWKLVYNRGGEYWRTNVQFAEFTRYTAPNGEQEGGFDQIGGIFADELNNRGFVGLDTHVAGFDGRGPGLEFSYHTHNDPELGSLSRFMGYGK